MSMEYCQLVGAEEEGGGIQNDQQISNSKLTPLRCCFGRKIENKNNEQLSYSELTY